MHIETLSLVLTGVVLSHLMELRLDTLARSAPMGRREGGERGKRGERGGEEKSNGESVHGPQHSELRCCGVTVLRCSV